ncbi:alanine--tRNA ligase [Roseibium denhamense]|uniref:Alanine--tRNA ligase n=1 Tax=Roseibium denhamense TaxID=76305 RepID=A0ABY1N7Y4_9HYPH|nr:alanine--tRNA ligase [Roseibium denhamense]MTI05982.1 alanine--tRNA ligase [Roseibium denhamense]SMP02527.1 alanyl-tRNA synthetase [Roseibium denhamense]
MTGVNDIRSTFLDYFKKNDHEVVDSGPLVPRNDPTLMFANAGMNQFKNVFTGLETRDYSRAVTTQKVVRAGGKHNDLDNVGYTARHHTFFEMLGNFSFGDYFKDRAIELAWNLITKDYGLPKDRLLVTVFSEDEEAAGYWKKIAGLSDDKIIRIPTSDNFWTMGDTGPCGPCSEIFYDHGDQIWGGPPGSAEEDGDRFIEIWNLVFMQYEQTPEKREDLPRPSIDTGMGIERLATILQGVHNNYDIDLFRALIAASEHETSVEATGAALSSHRVIADHLRSTSFLIADGVLPSNEGRGYVLRRIMRRGMRHAHLLGARDPLMHKLVPALVREMGQAYPELIRAKDLITETLLLEEKRFRKTLERGLGLLDDATTNLAPGGQLDGETAFKLYDTYGFPLDLTQDALRARDISVDTDGFGAAMERQKAEARAAWSGSGGAATEAVWFSLKEKHGATDFLGYETEIAEGIVVALADADQEVGTLKTGQSGFVVLNQTPFYGESGGQVGDTGQMTAPGVQVAVTNTQKKADGLFVHAVRVEEGELAPGTALELKVDHKRRSSVRANHSATHLVHEALREVLGTHVAQKGSLVSPDRLRFDFSHPKPMSDDELATVEAFANEIVLQNAPVDTRLMAVDDAIEAGAMALFGEKYGDEVRVVSMGTALHGDKTGKPYSLELCGGTHVKRTGDIGLVTLVSEGAVASGVRRLEALTGAEARNYLDAQDKRMRQMAALLKTGAEDVPDRVAQLVEDRRRLEKELAEAKKKLAMGGGGDAGTPIRDAGKFKLMARTVEGINPKDLKGMADEAKTQLGSGVVVLINVAEEGKAAIVTAVTKDLTESVSAVDLVKIGSETLGGRGGGGRPDMAQAGGPDGAKADEAIAAIEAHLKGI